MYTRQAVHVQVYNERSQRLERVCTKWWYVWPISHTCRIGDLECFCALHYFFQPSKLIKNPWHDATIWGLMEFQGMTLRNAPVHSYYGEPLIGMVHQWHGAPGTFIPLVMARYAIVLTQWVLQSKSRMEYDGAKHARPPAPHDRIPAMPNT